MWMRHILYNSGATQSECANDIRSCRSRMHCRPNEDRVDGFCQVRLRSCGRQTYPVGDSKACEYAAKTNSCFTTCACEAVTCDGFSSLPSGSPASMEQNDAYVQGVCDMMSDNNCGSFKCGSGSSLRTLITFTLVAAITVLWYAQ